MSLTFKWSVSKVGVEQQKGKANIVTNVDWIVQAIDSNNNLSASAAGTRNFALGSTFTAYEKLTEQQVLAWCFQPETISVTDKDNNVRTVTKNLKDEGEAQVAGQIIRQLAQAAAEPALPWVTA